MSLSNLEPKMSDDLKLKKFTEDLTPMRALSNFFDVATPVDSPDPEDLVQFGPVGLFTSDIFSSFAELYLIDFYYFQEVNW